MELLGVSPLASREQAISPTLRAIGEENELSVRADLDLGEQKTDAHSDFATIFTFLFPSSSPGEREKNEEQRGSTAFGLANHVDALFPQSLEETFPSSPESVPTHGVSSALSSPLPIIPIQKDKPEIRITNQREVGVALQDTLPIDLFAQADLPVNMQDDGTAPMTMEEGRVLPTHTSHMPSRYLHREEEDDNLIQGCAPSDLTTVSQAQAENLYAALLLAPSAPDTPISLIPEPERDDPMVESPELSAFPVYVPPPFLSMVTGRDISVAPTLEREASPSPLSPSAFTSPLVQDIRGHDSDRLFNFAAKEPVTQFEPANAQSARRAIDSGSRVPLASDLVLATDTPEALVALPHSDLPIGDDTIPEAALPERRSSDVRLLATDRPETLVPLPHSDPPVVDDPAPKAAPQEGPSPEVRLLADELHSARSEEKPFPPPFALPFASRTSRGLVSEGSNGQSIRETGYASRVSHPETANTNSQWLASSIVQTDQIRSLGGQSFRSSTKTDIRGEISESEAIPILSVNDNMEGPSRLIATQTQPRVTEDIVERRLRVSAIPTQLSPEGDTLRVGSPVLNIPHFSPPLTRNSATAGPVIIEQVAGEIATHISQGSKKAVLALEPQELGKVQIDLVLDGEQVQVRIITETTEVSTLMQAHLPELKNALQHYNLELGTVSVDVNTREGEHGASADTAQQHFGTHNRESGRETPAQPQDAEPVVRQRPNAVQLQQPGVSVWA